MLSENSNGIEAGSTGESSSSSGANDQPSENSNNNNEDDTDSEKDNDGSVFSENEFENDDGNSTSTDSRRENDSDNDDEEYMGPVERDFIRREATGQLVIPDGQFVFDPEVGHYVEVEQEQGQEQEQEPVSPSVDPINNRNDRVIPTVDWFSLEAKPWSTRKGNDSDSDKDKDN